MAFHIAGPWSFVLEAKAQGHGTGDQQTSISKTVRVIKPCQLRHRPFGCSAVITSYVPR